MEKIHKTKPKGGKFKKNIRLKKIVRHSKC